MNIKIDERHVDGITVLDIVGKLTIDEAAEHLRDKINSLIAQKETRIILNLQHVPYIDSGGLGELIASFGSVTRAANDIGPATSTATAASTTTMSLFMNCLLVVFCRTLRSLIDFGYCLVTTCRARNVV